MKDTTSRLAMLIGEEAVQKLGTCRVAVFGLGGVGGHAVEALARSGIGALHLVDNDSVSLSNLNRQLFATHTTIGKKKTDAAKDRIMEIAPDCDVTLYPIFYEEATADAIDLSQFDYIIDAIDSVKSKLLLITRAMEAGTPIISCMGTGNKFDPSRLTVTDISKTEMCPLARVVRTELRKRGIHHLKVVYSKEPAMVHVIPEEEGVRPVPGSTAFVPAAAGLLLASEVVKDLLSLIPANGTTPAHMPNI